jgi:hypothetical protein
MTDTATEPSPTAATDTWNLQLVLASFTVSTSESWKVGGGYSFPWLSKRLKPLLAPYRLAE